MPEVSRGEIVIKAVVREPGERAKVLVHSEDPKIDPVGVIVGVKGSRIAPISEELSGEKIDVIRWTPDEEELRPLCGLPQDGPQGPPLSFYPSL